MTMLETDLGNLMIKVMILRGWNCYLWRYLVISVKEWTSIFDST